MLTRSWAVFSHFPPTLTRVPYVTYTLPLYAATSGVKWVILLDEGSGLTFSGSLQVAPPSADNERTMSLYPLRLNRASCQLAYRIPVTGSTAAEGSPPVRMPGTPDPSNCAIFTGLPKVFPPSVDVWATS